MALASGQARAQQCKDSLAHLSTKIANFADDDLRQLRNRLLATRMDDIEASIRAQGMPLSKAAALTLAQAKEYEKTFQESKACAVRVFDGDETALARALDGRRYDASLSTRLGGSTTIREMVEGGRNQNMLGSCLRSFIATDMGKTATEESAVQLTCRAAAR